MKNKGIFGGIIVVVLVLVLALAVGGGSVSAEEPTIIASGDCGKDGSNVTWKLDSAGLLTISGEGEMEDYSAIGYAYDNWITTAPWQNRASKLIIQEGVTSIGGYAFYNCGALKSVTIPDSVTSIGGYAFNGCTGLTSVTIPNSVTNIGKYAFYDCTSLTSATIGNSVTSIGEDAFSSCTGLTEILYNAKAAADLALGSDVFRNAGSSSGGLRVIIGDGVKKIPSCLFYGCTGLTSVTIPDSVTSIGSTAFRDCTGLSSVTIPDSVTSIGGSAFYGCAGLTCVTIGNGVTSIGGYAFSRCTGLTEIIYNAKAAADLGNGPDAFYSAGISSGGFRVVIGDGVEKIPGYLFSDCTGLTSVTIGNSVTSIGGYAFNGCTGLTSVTIPNSVTNIGGYAFYGCTGLTEIYYNAKAVEKVFGSFSSAGTSSDGLRVVIGDGVEKIPSYLFSDCTGLTEILYNAKAAADLKSYSNVFSNAGTSSDGLRVVIGDGVERIPGYLFRDCAGLTSVTIPDSVTSIGGGAFYGCTGLKSVTIPDSVTSIEGGAFYGCTGLKSVTIPDSVTSIEGCVFYGCTGLTSVTIPDSVTSIGDWAFRDCTGLTSVTIGNSVTSIGGYAFNGCTGLTSVTIPDSVTSIGENAFSDCTGLTEIYYNAKAAADLKYSDDVFEKAGTSSDSLRVVIGDGVERIPGYLFRNCTGLTGVTIGNGVTSIGYCAFEDCTGLTSVTIPDSVTSIGNGAFSGCTNLTEVYYNAKSVKEWSSAFNGAGTSSGGFRAVIGDSVEYIPANLFCDCAGLTSVTIGNSVASIGNRAFFDCAGLTSVTIPNSVTSIGGGAFYGCTGLTSVTIGNSVTSIGGSAFYGCTGLTSVTIPNSVTSIGGSAFYGCTGLTSVTIPNSVTSIGKDAFRGCTGLASVEIPNSVTSIGYCAFYGCTGLTEILYNAKAAADLGSESNVFYNAGISSGGFRAVIGDSVERIPSYLFYDCTGLTSVTIGNGATSIGDYAFVACNGLKSVTIPNNVTSIGKEAFNCNGLTEVIYNAKAVADLNWGSYVFYNAGTSSGGFRVVIGDSVERIPSYLFYNCTGLTSVTIGGGMTSIGNYAFYGCLGLTEIYYNAKAATDLKESPYAFRNVGSSSGSVKVFIGEKVKKIPAYLFTEASNIRTFEFAGDPPEVGYAALLSNRTGASYAYYPMHNGAWTESARKACGSYLTWIGYCYEPISTGTCKINKTVYMTGDTLDANGISMTVTHEDGCVETIAYNSGLLKLGSYDMSTPGVKLIDVTYKDITAQLKICVYERKTEVMDKAGYPESSHDYENNLDKTYTYEAKGAITLDVTFSPQTEVETNVDYLYVNGTKYTGTALAGKTITVNGDTLTIRLVSDKSDSAYGFSIDRIVKTYINAETVVPPTCTERGYTMYLASGTVGNFVDALGHSFGDDQICSVCAAKLESIYISALPAKTVYSVGNGSLNLTGGKLMLVCDSGETEVNLTAAMVSGFDNTILGKQTLTVTVGGLTTTFEVEVVERTVISVAVENGKLVKHYTDGTTEETPLKDGAISDFAISETGEKTLTLTSENACVAAYKDADGNYVALKAVANEDGSYSYVVPEEVTEVTVAVKGDLDGDGRINMKDLAQLRRNMAEGTVEGGLEQLLIDFNGDGVVNMKDMGILRRYLAGGYGVELGW